ncbi:conserved hypothetical protein [Desulfosarcina cetonica]|uniref:hypothetical protein n=1 Tax=Desulfosarcina cetonica TaxID=90730 RepID=UPI0006CFCFA4|nr:hypothetical protein [Desulfosarcina cetonica]VTR64128.1 conserved hypothetical protein [Desulfosarcina cetonica]
MKVRGRRKLLLQQFDENMANLDRSLSALRYSYSKCITIYEKALFDNSEQESLEALTSRFARTSDIFTQKVLKTLFALIQENPKTFLDAANLLEKIEIVDNADDLLNIRELRNQIAHEYVNDDLHALFSDVVRFVPEIERIVDKLKSYMINKEITID